VNLIQDDRKASYPDAMPVPGGTIVQPVDDATVTTFSPALNSETSYYLTTSGSCRFAVHNADYSFDPDANAILQASDVRMIKLGDRDGKWTTLSLQSVAGSVNVVIEQLQ
jgi:hypothetical protein